MKLQEIADKLEISLRVIKRYKAEFKKVPFTNQVVPPTISIGVSSLNFESSKVANSLADTFSLYAEREDTEKIPIRGSVPKGRKVLQMK